MAKKPIKKRDGVGGAAAGADRIAREQGIHMVGVTIAGEMTLINVPGEPGIAAIDGARPDLFEALDVELAAATPEMLVSVAGPWVRQGIERRQQGALVQAYLYARASLWIALRTANPVGIAAVSTNLFVAREGIRNILERGLGPTRMEIPIDGKGGARELEAGLRGAQALIPGDAAAALSRASVLQAAVEQNASPRIVLGFLHALHRFAVLAGDAAARETWRERLLAQAARHQSWSEVLEAAAEDLAGVDLEEVLLTLTSGGTCGPVERYDTVRTHVETLGRDQGFLSAAANAFRHLTHLRLRATAAGGAFGHALSYRMSAPLQHVGRDLVWMLKQAGREAEALETAEEVRARALSDWMGRTHPHHLRIPRAFVSAINPLTGSVNATEPATLEDMTQIAATTGATILAYLQLGHRVAVWAMSPDGSIISDDFDDPSPLVAALVKKMPYLGAPDPAILAPAGAAGLDRELELLYAAVLPERLRELIESSARIAILTDGILDVVPFAALRTAGGKYLVEDHEIVFWPSLAAWLQVETAGGIVHEKAARRRALVFARTTFAEPVVLEAHGVRRELNLPDLPGAKEEAEQARALLDGELVADAAATWAELQRARKAIGVLHIATHGILDVEDPARSFLSLADGPLTAWTLYQYDPGIRAELVVLSACQTALGAAHPDSVIGLANAFLVAGANAIVSSLWRLPDAPTRMFMNAFYSELKASAAQTIPGALRAAQQALLRSDVAAYRHPICWAAFKATGRAANPLV